MIKVPVDWPYWPPEEDDFKPLSEHWRPADYLLLSEAVDIVGRATFGEEWTGQELKARRLGKIISVQPPSEEESVISPDDAGVQHMPITQRERWRVITTQGKRFVSSEEDALALWEREKPKLLEMWQKEDAARSRHDAVVQKLRTDLNAGTLNAWAHRTDAGDLIEIPLHVWGRDDVSLTFELGNDPSKWRNPNIVEFTVSSGGFAPSRVKGRVLLKHPDIEHYVATTPDIVTPPHRTGGESEFTTPYLDLMGCVAQDLGLKKDIRTPKDVIEHSLCENWPKFIDGPISNRMVEQMATALRQPKDQVGGRFKSSRDE